MFALQSFSLLLIGGEATLTQLQAAALSFYFSIPQLTKSQQGQTQQVAARFRYNRGVAARPRVWEELCCRGSHHALQACHCPACGSHGDKLSSPFSLVGFNP